MYRQHLLVCGLGFVSGVFTLNQYEGISKFLPALLGLGVLLVLTEVLMFARARRHQAFAKVLDSYVTRHENDLSHSGAHVF
ncbi:hypothetical protein N8553_01715 [bacterium]|nr:hypothetical protein [bacterium]